jgi:predicted PurR-regulated permease PerM
VVIGIVVYFGVRLLSHLSEAIIPFIVAMLVTALLRPVLQFLRHHGVHRGVATILSVLLAVVVIGGVITLVVIRATEQATQLGQQINRLIPDVERWLENGPLQVNKTTVNNFSKNLSSEISKNSKAIASAALSTGKTVLDILTGIVVAVFVTIFLLYDGEGVWGFLVRAVPEPGRERANAAGHAAWQTLTHYVRGTLIIAAFHGLVIGIALEILGVPLVLPLALLVAIGSFVPIVGAVVTGVLAILLVIDNQIESHLLQPFVVGRYVRIHPLATVMALITGALLFGIFGAIIAVPTVACANSAVRSMLKEPEAPAPMAPEDPPDP